MYIDCVVGMSPAYLLGESVMRRNREAWIRAPRLLAACGLERIAYETARAASGRHVTMKWLAAARDKAERAGFTLEEIDRCEAIALAERGQS